MQLAGYVNFEYLYLRSSLCRQKVATSHWVLSPSPKQDLRPTSFTHNYTIATVTQTSTRHVLRSLLKEQTRHRSPTSS